MKKLIALLLCFIVLFSFGALLSGCGVNQGNSVSDTTQEDPTEEPTEAPTEPEINWDEIADELMDYPDVVFRQKIKNLSIFGEMTSRGKLVTYELSVQRIAEEETLVYYKQETSAEYLFRVNDGNVTMYFPEGDKYVEDPTIAPSDVKKVYTDVMNILRLHINTPNMMGDGLKYHKIGVEESEKFGEVVTYHVYSGDKRVRILHVQVETGITVIIADGDDAAIMSITDLTQEVDLLSKLG